MQENQTDDSRTVDNRGGAGGTIGLAQFVSSHKHDPNALLVGGMVMMGAILLNKSPVDLSQVTPIARLTGEAKKASIAKEMVAAAAPRVAGSAVAVDAGVDAAAAAAAASRMRF